MNVKLEGNELYNLYNYRENFIFLYKKIGKGFHPYFERGYLGLLSSNGKCKLKWTPISNTAVYDWEKVNDATSKDGRAMIRTVFEKNLNPSLREIS